MIPRRFRRQSTYELKDYKQAWSQIWKKKRRIKVEDLQLDDKGSCAVKELYGINLSPSNYAPKPIPVHHIETRNLKRLVYTAKVPLVEGMHQVEQICNSVQLNNNYFEANLKNITDFQSKWMNYLVHYSNFLATEHELLPRRIDPEFREFRFYRETFITPKKSLSLILDNMLREFVDPQSNKICDEMCFRGQKKMDDFKKVIFSNRPLSPVEIPPSTKANVRNADDPVNPFIDFVPRKFVDEDKYNLDTKFDDNSVLKNPDLIPNTLFIDNTCDELSFEMRQSRALLHLYLLAHLIKSYKPDLKLPLALQCVHTDGIRFHLLFFQLNSLKNCINSPNIYSISPFNFLVEKHLRELGRMENAILDNFSNKTVQKLYSLLNK